MYEDIRKALKAYNALGDQQKYKDSAYYTVSYSASVPTCVIDRKAFNPAYPYCPYLC